MWPLRSNVLDWRLGLGSDSDVSLGRGGSSGGTSLCFAQKVYIFKAVVPEHSTALPLLPGQHT
uniref:Uncharacterized protein n=1 Tax=Anguilla anguilla TaxID=7936 RepID=A0A0E9WTS2_ANGAN